MNAPREAPDFLKRKEADALFAWWSSGRLLIMKDKTKVSLSGDDLLALRRFLAQFEGEGQ